MPSPPRHARGIVHRDVKPGNVLIGRDGRVKVVDFGIARAIAEAQMTLPGTTLGSVHYFSPEQARGEPATNESDIYSLGIVLYEMLTGTRPWEGDSAAAVALARLSGPVPDPTLVRGSIPPDLAAITRKALAPLPADRFASAAAMAEALEAARAAATSAAAATAAAAGGRRCGWSALPDPTRPWCPTRRMPTPAPAARLRRHQVPSRTTSDEGTSPVVWVAGLIAIGLLAAIAFLVFQLLSGPNEPTTPTRSPSRTSSARSSPTRRARRTASASCSSRRMERSDQPAGTIIAQDPPEGTVVAPGSEVARHRRRGPRRPSRRPNLRNKTEAQAVQEIVQAGLCPGHQDRGVRSDRADRPDHLAEPGAWRHRRQGIAGRLRRLEGPGADPDPDARRPRRRRPSRPRRRRPTRPRRRRPYRPPTPTPAPTPTATPAP